ncbi:two-component system histidine kinase PnpS [Mammaliicoccus vitulinus]|uniref:Sensor protein kinase WalK n=1 Tax=Mammaliicoccus vitulinus TaxID=71237 RepID=A0ABX7HD51_9STAP|nr:ATP-binding protein [Mammaliicoccus vitulinus]PNZ39082.1 PAS domain-containing sensor histidine kinase [Mammaliicoccus vitulinus]QRO84539.1 PAS domain-containing protein [Mammaliicoccus vitulinus]QTN11798.1 PAS domain-containing protein [Mammaliicoccus vitulinus]
MIKFYNKLLIILTTVTVVSFLILGFFLHNSSYDLISKQQQKSLKTESKNIYDIAKKNPKNIDEILDVFNQDIILEKNDKMIYHSNNVDTKLFKNEKEQALSDAKTFDEYFAVDKTDSEVMFAKKYGDYTIAIAKHTDTISIIQKDIWKYLLLVLFFTLPLIYFVVRYINTSYIHPIKEVTYATKLLASGKYRVRVPESNVKETKELFINTNELARTLDDLNNEQKLQRNRLETTLENIPSATLMVDREGVIVIANKTYHDLFDRVRNAEGQLFKDVMPNVEITQMMNEALKLEKPMFEQVELYINNVHNKFFEVSVIPVLSRKKRNLLGLVVVMHDITKLKKLEHMRKDFVANVSHELRTPITSIKGFAETLLDGAKNDPESLDMFLNIMLDESNRIQSLVQDLLDLSKIEQNDEIPKEPISLTEIAEHSINTVSTVATKKDIELVNKIDQNVVSLGDKDKMTQVMINLLSNAISYSPRSSQIILTVKDVGDGQIISVQDNGIGISEDEQKRIFERFYRVDKARSRDSGGTGLGLSITKHIIEAHNGQIKVESEVGQGSHFIVKLFNE